MMRRDSQEYDTRFYFVDIHSKHLVYLWELKIL